MNLVKIDYNRMMEDEIAKFSNEKKPTLLLHSCCGPCSTTCLERLIDFFEITVFFYNPNIQPKEEFELRLESQKKFLSNCEKMKNVKLVVPDYNTNEFLNFIDLENFPERKAERECGKPRGVSADQYSGHPGADGCLPEIRYYPLPSGFYR